MQQSRVAGRPAIGWGEGRSGLGLAGNQGDQSNSAKRQCPISMNKKCLCLASGEGEGGGGKVVYIATP